MSNNIYKGEVLEHALNFGIASASNRFGISRSEVIVIVKDFKNDIEDNENGHPCSCELARRQGHTMMCFICDRQNGNFNYRINL